MKIFIITYLAISIIGLLTFACGIKNAIEINPKNRFLWDDV